VLCLIDTQKKYIVEAKEKANIYFDKQQANNKREKQFKINLLID